MRLIFSQQTASIAMALISVLMIVSLAGCERDMMLTMDGANPPTFKLSGSGRLIFFTVFEPVPGKPSINDPKMWEIRPINENLISKLPAITYGVVPQGFRQTIPSAGTPPSLTEGKVYEAGGPAFNANGGSIRFTIKDGRAVILSENK
ncbi:MAG TPA: hypothetical protein VGJ66_17475 [Pyrinomonadaceae bacterium]|jgi:hypothetical protein